MVGLRGGIRSFTAIQIASRVNPEIEMRDFITHAGHFPPWNGGISGANRGGYVFGCLSDHLDRSHDSIERLLIIDELLVGHSLDKLLCILERISFIYSATCRVIGPRCPERSLPLALPARPAGESNPL